MQPNGHVSISRHGVGTLSSKEGSLSTRLTSAVQGMFVVQAKEVNDAREGLYMKRML